MFDIKITGGKVLDGLGGPAVSLDIGIAGDRITGLGDLAHAPARLTLAAAGRYVCPGFIDVHSHSDAYLLIEPSAQSKIYQGVTTEVVGNCGASAAPLGARYNLPSDWADKSYPGRWSTVAEYRGLLESVKPAPNVVVLIGHNTLRAGIAGYENRALTASELVEAKRLLAQSLDEGGRGLSTGLIYAPAMFAPREELVELAKVAAERGGIYTTHMRSEGKNLLEAIAEAIALGRAAGIRVQISHLKTSGRDNWRLIDRALDLIRAARDEGLSVAADRYPYTAGCTDLDVVFPAWAAEGGRDAVLARLRNPADRQKLKEQLQKSRTENDWAGITIGSTEHPDNRAFRGLPLPEVAASLRLDLVDAVLYLAESDRLKTSAFFGGMCEENMMRILAEPYVMLGSDASLRATSGPLSADYPHPRAYGSFPKFLRLALDGKTVRLEEAVRKMTSLPADHFRLAGRGRIAQGAWADLVIFDPEKCRDLATYADPHRLSEGIETVIVNGITSLAAGRLTGNRGGRLL